MLKRQLMSKYHMATKITFLSREKQNTKKGKFKLCTNSKIKSVLTKDIIYIIFSLHALIFTSNIYAQVPAPAQAKAVDVDIINQQVKGSLPYDVKFELTGMPTQVADRLELTSVIEDAGSSGNLISGTITWIRQIPRNGTDDSKAEKFSLLFTNGKYLRPNHRYTFTIVVSEIVYPGTYNAISTLLITGYTQSSLSDHIKLDFGIGYAPKPQAMIGLTTVHAYLSPINEDTDLADSDLSSISHLSQRVSFFAGISPITFSDNTEQGITKKYGLGNFVYGIGLRSIFYSPMFNTGKVGRIFLQPLRIDLGILNFKQKNKNIAVTGDINKQSPYFSITYDLNIASVLGPIGTLLTK